MTDRKHFVELYFARLTAGEIEDIIGMFEDGGHIQSPFLGQIKVGAFFRKLDNASAASNLTVFDILFGENQDSAAAHFQYEWTLHDGNVLDFEGIDYFKFGPSGKFSSLSIYYDTHPLRLDVGDKYANA